MPAALAADKSKVPRLRQPIPLTQALVLVLSSGAYMLAQHWAGALTPTAFLILLGLLEFVIQPVSYLIHELGHAVAARRLGAKNVSIMVGRGPYLRFSLGSVRVNFSFLPSRGVMIRGVCRYDASDLDWRSRAVIALSGPAATLLELLAGLAVARLVWSGAGTLERNLLLFSLIGLGSSLVINLAPIQLKRNGQATIFGNDGTQARAALARHRESASEPQPARSVATATPVPAAPSEAGLARQRDAHRARTSVAPPAPPG
jgi:hypothetical protein